MATASGDFDPRERLSRLGAEIKHAYARNRRVMSFDEYFALFCANPAPQLRSAAQILLDVFDHFGKTDVAHPCGNVERWRLFDVPWAGGQERLVGQEAVQAQVRRALEGFAREGRVNKLLLLHGPNGSAKSTLIACLARALEHYSTLDEGACYRFNWVFPSERVTAAGIGFGGAGEGHGPGDSYATLGDEQVDALLEDELRDHPLLLLPGPRRRELIAELLAGRALGDFTPARYVLDGELGPRNRRICDALLHRYRGDYLKVLRHVQVERFFVERRYRVACATVEPQLHVDARARQITVDRSVSALPPALQSMSLHEYGGELVDANRGLLEYADLLKRPIEAWKYLLGTVEHARVPVEDAILFLDVVFIGSSNESHLAVFKEVPEFQSFKGRMELIRVPYLLDHEVERTIYDEKLPPERGGKHVAPHATMVAALWAVLTRVRKPVSDRFPRVLAELVGRLGPLDKADLYAHGTVPAAFSPEQARELRAHAELLFTESASYPNYEGRSGASPREMQTVLLNAAASVHHACLSPAAVLGELEEFVKQVSVHEFLKQDPLPGGFHDNRRFIAVVQDRWLDRVNDELLAALGLVDEGEFGRLFERYVINVTHSLRKEKVRNPVTGRLDPPDAELLAEVEKSLGVTTRRDEFRQETITRIGAWSLDHPGQKPAYGEIFPRQFELLREAAFAQRKVQVERVLDDLLVVLTDGGASLDAEARACAEESMTRLAERHGYCRGCAREALAALLRRRRAG